MVRRKHGSRRKGGAKPKRMPTPAVAADRGPEDAAQGWQEPPGAADQLQGENQSVEGPLSDQPETDIERGLGERAASDIERPKR